MSPAPVLNLALVGYGKMGRALREAARTRGHNVVACIDPSASGAGGSELEGRLLDPADVVLEFTTPGAAPGNLRVLLAAGRKVVCGTTGWSEKLPEIQALAADGGGALLWGPNFSVGVQILFRIVARAAEWFARGGGFEPYLVEEHHRMKKDAPSGSAQRLGDILLQATPGKTRLAPAPAREAIPDDTIPVAWIRAGEIPGTHLVGWDGPGETVEIVHRARDRGVFAHGALLAAEWLAGKQGFYSIDEWVAELMGEEKVR